MTRIPTRTMPDGPGPEMDALVAKALGGGIDKSCWPWGSPHSVDVAHAMRALETWREQHPDWDWRTGYSRRRNVYSATLFRYEPWPARLDGQHCVEAVTAENAPTLAAAICEALIRAQWAVEDAEAADA